MHPFTAPNSHPVPVRRRRFPPASATIGPRGGIRTAARQLHRRLIEGMAASDDAFAIHQEWLRKPSYFRLSASASNSVVLLTTVVDQALDADSCGS